MKTRTHNAACPEEYLTAYGLDPDRVIYFDIETTGFRPSTSSLYMIGWAVRCAPGEWTVVQIMSQTYAEERRLLETFTDVLSRYDTIIAFNGDRFDLPYLREKYEAHKMADPFALCRTVDLYQEIRPYKEALGLKRLNQKSVERFLKIHREDPYNGGELIDVYRSVRDHRYTDDAQESEAVHALFLHNYEDVLGMLDMTPLLAYPMAAGSTVPVQCTGGFPDTSAMQLEASFRLDVPVPKPLCLSHGEHCSIHVCGDLVSVTLQPLSGCLYHFFPDYRNYYYLPAEDTAMHKSVASYVDPSHREKAKAQNCYVKKEGLFLPCSGTQSSGTRKNIGKMAQAPAADEFFGPLFQRFYKDPVLWFAYRPELLKDTEAFSAYIHGIVF